MSNTLPDSIFYWNFYSSSGDAWSGYTITDTLHKKTAPEGTISQSPYGQSYGYYKITNVVDTGVDLSTYYNYSNYTEGATFVHTYYDAASSQALSTRYGSQGIPTSFKGFGSEYDYVSYNPNSFNPAGRPLPAVADRLDDFGYGGYFLVDVFLQ